MKIISASAQSTSQDASSIQITLSEQNKQIIISGSHQLTLDHHEDLYLKAIGANGQNGHIGANGRNGNPGVKGYNATQTYPGQNGSDGEDGQPGFPGSHGTKAGSGGEIDVFVDSADLALLPVISSYDVSAGTPGQAGRHGQGGHGGIGGPGGEPCKWTESEVYIEVERYWPPKQQRQVMHSHPSQHTHNHHGHIDAVQYEWYQPPQEERTVTKTRLVNKSNPGGHPGQSGQRGFTPTTPLYPGQPGKAGQFRIHITQKGSVIETHPFRYELNLNITSPQDTNYRYEPGETISLAYAAYNTGKTMTSPIESMPLEVIPSSSFTCHQTSVIPGAILPGKARNADHPIKITCPTVVHDRATPYAARLPITTKLMNPRLGSAFTTDTLCLNIEYPAQLTLSQTAASVRNHSQKILGKAAHRTLAITLRDSQNKILKNQEIESLCAQNTHDIDFKTLPLGAGVWFDKPVKYVFDLCIEPIDRSREQILIQRQTTMIQSLFQLPLQVLSVENESQSSVFEPGDNVLITYGVDNTANEVDYPGTEPLTIQLADSSSFSCKQESQIVDPILTKKSQGANQKTILKIAPVTHPQSEAYKQQLPIQARLVSKSYDGTLSKMDYTLPIQYPVQLELPQQEFAILSNESLSFPISLNNISNKPLGTDTDRTVQVNVTDKHHRVLHSFPITQLTPHRSGQTIDSSAMHLKFSDEAWLGEQSRYFVDLLLQPSDKSLPMTVIQRKLVSMRLVTAYEPAYSGIFTLVLNQSISSEVQRAWYYFLSQLSGEKNIAIYDTSHYKEFPIDKLVSDNKKGSVVWIPEEQSSYSITARQMLDAYQKHQTAVIAVGADITHCVQNSYNNTTSLLDDADKQNTNNHHSYDELIHALLTAKEDEVSHQLEIKLDYFFERKNNPHYHVQQIREILSNTFPNRAYHVSCKQADKGIAVFSIRRLADPTHESVKTVESQRLNSATKQVFIKTLPFSQKLKFFTAPANPYREKLATSIQEDLQEEQQRLNQTQSYGTWWQRMNNQFDQSQMDMRYLKALVNCLKNYHDQADFTSFNAWSPFVMAMITQVKKQVKDSISFWDKFVHFFSPQAKVHCAKSAETLCDEALNKLKGLPVN